MSISTRKIRLRKVVLVSIIVLIVLGGFLILRSGRRTSESGKSLDVALDLGTGNIIETKKDSDKDGLADWEETIYGTDPQNPDSDGDGYWDGEEIASGYNPLKPAPEDKTPDTPSTPRPAPGEIDISQISPHINLTKVLANKLSGQIAKSLPSSVKDINNIENPEINLDSLGNLDELVKGELSKYPSPLTLPYIADEDIKTSTNNKRAIEKYLSSSLNIISRNLSSVYFAPEQRERELQIVSLAFETGNLSELQKLTRNYEKTIEELKKLTVPSSLTDLHKKELQTLTLFRDFFQNCQKIKEDPLKTILALNQYKVLLAHYLILRQDIKSHL